MTIAYNRGRLSNLLSELPPRLRGGMLAAGVGEEEAQAYLEKATKGQAVVACINSPSSVTISGDLAAILEIEAMMKADGRFARRLKVETAYHSPHMRGIGAQYRDLLDKIQTLPEDAQAPKMFSSVTGGLVDNSQLGPEYWVSNMLNPVRFSQAAQALLEHSENRKRKRAKVKPYVYVLVEVGPHGALQGPIKQILSAAGAECLSLSVLTRGHDAARSALEVVGRLFQQGYPARIGAANAPCKGTSKPKLLVDLPPFPGTTPTSTGTSQRWRTTIDSRDCPARISLAFWMTRETRPNLAGATSCVYRRTRGSKITPSTTPSCIPPRA